MDDKQIASVCCEVHQAYCQALGDDSQRCWSLASQWEKQSTIAVVKFIHENRDVGPAAIHQEWLRQKKADGWVYGERKDEQRKEHPCMMDWAFLPQEQRAKDFIFHAVVRALLD